MSASRPHRPAKGPDLPGTSHKNKPDWPLRLQPVPVLPVYQRRYYDNNHPTVKLPLYNADSPENRQTSFYIETRITKTSFRCSRTVPFHHNPTAETPGHTLQDTIAGRAGRYRRALQPPDSSDHLTS